MITYRAKFLFVDGGVHAEVIDFPGAISCGQTLEEARQMLASALVDMAESHILQGQPLPQPDPACSDLDADLDEPIHLLLSSCYQYVIVPQDPQGTLR